ncbi:MAG: hypothetical protein QXF02_00255 [Candidatus Korarchaeota archaeon]
MPARKNEIITDFHKLWAKIVEELKEEESCVVVEGIKDKKILLMIGIPPNKIICVNCSKLDHIVNKISLRFKRTYLLLDRDARGRQKMHILRRMLEQNRIEAIDLWEHIFYPLKIRGFKSIRKVEEMKKIALIISENTRYCDTD